MEMSTFVEDSKDIKENREVQDDKDVKMNDSNDVKESSKVVKEDIKEVKEVKDTKMNDSKEIEKDIKEVKKADVEVRFSIGDEDVFDNTRLERPAAKRTQNVRKPRSLSESSYKSTTSETGNGMFIVLQCHIFSDKYSSAMARAFCCPHLNKVEEGWYLNDPSFAL